MSTLVLTIYYNLDLLSSNTLISEIKLLFFRYIELISEIMGVYY